MISIIYSLFQVAESTHASIKSISEEEQLTSHHYMQALHHSSLDLYVFVILINFSFLKICGPF